MLKTAICACAFITLLGCSSTITTSLALRNVSARPLGFKGRLAGGDAQRLPQSVAAALDPSSDIAFVYDERVTEAHHELPGPVMVFLTATLHLLGAPMGYDEATAQAELTVVRGAQEIGRYRGSATASRVCGIYYGASMPELDDEARNSVRQAIDEALYEESVRLADAVSGP